MKWTAQGLREWLMMLSTSRNKLPCIWLRQSTMLCKDWLMPLKALATAFVSPHRTPLTTLGMLWNVVTIRHKNRVASWIWSYAFATTYGPEYWHVIDGWIQIFHRVLLNSTFPIVWKNLTTPRPQQQNICDQVSQKHPKSGKVFPEKWKLRRKGPPNYFYSICT